MEVLGKNFVFCVCKCQLFGFSNRFTVYEVDLIDSFKILDLNSKQVITLVLYFLQEMGCSSPNSDFGIQGVISCFKVIPSFCLKIGLIFFVCVLFFCSKKNDNLLNYFFS